MGLFEHKIKDFPRIAEWVEGIDASGLGDYLSQGEGTRLFLGSGGSFNAAVFGQHLSLDKGMVALGLTPYFYASSPFYCSHKGKVLLVSASGNNKDVLRAYEKCVATGVQEIAALTLSTDGMLQKRFMEDRRGETLFSFSIPTGRDGFISSTTVLAFYLLLCKAYGYTGMDSVGLSVSAEESARIDDFVNRLKRIPQDGLTEHEAFLHKLEGVDSFFVLYSARSFPAALDLESKFSEGAVANSQLADYRNFAHGRFNWFTQRPGQTGVICLAADGDMPDVEEITSRVPNHVPCLCLSSKLPFPLCTIDLLVKEHFLCSALAARWGLDISRPVIPPYGRYLYNL